MQPNESLPDNQACFTDQQHWPEYEFAHHYLTLTDRLIVVIDKNQLIKLINPKGCELLQCDSTSVIGQNWFEHFIPSQHKKSEYYLFNQLLQGHRQQVTHWQSQLISRSGQVFQMAWHYVVIKSSDGHPTAVIASGKDITFQKQIQYNHQQSVTMRAFLHQFMFLALKNESLAQMLKTVINKLTSLSALNLLPQGVVYLYDDKISRFLPYTSEGMASSDQLHRDDLTKIFTHLQQQHHNCLPHYQAVPVAANEVNTYELFIPLSGHEEHLTAILHFFLAPGKPPNESYNHVLQSIADILVTIIQQKKAEEQSALAFHRVKCVMDAITSVLIVINGQNEVTYWNKSAEQVFDLPAEQVLGCYFPNLPLSWTWRPLLKKIPFIRYKNNQLTFSDIHYQKPDGRQGILNLTITSVKGANLHQSEFLLVATDMTEHKILQSQLLQAQKLEAVGQLAAGVAHEINTPIQYIGDNLRFIQDMFEEQQSLLKQIQHMQQTQIDPAADQTAANRLMQLSLQVDASYLLAEIPQAVGQSLDGIERVTGIVRALKDFAHPDAGQEKQPVDINQLIQSTVTVCRNEWKYVATVETNLDPDLPPVSCYPGAINQIILNLVVNAAHAVAEQFKTSKAISGLITIKTKSKGHEIVITVADNGTGIPPDIEKKIYNPFFTTKEVGKGTGQGLAICHDLVVKKHNGRIHLDSAIGQGSRFTITLPVKDTL